MLTNRLLLVAIGLILAACTRADPHPQVRAEVTSHSAERPASCPRCRGSSIVPIAYGLLAPAGEQRVRDGLAVSGGCEVSRDSPDWHCKTCSHRWYDGADPKREAARDARDRAMQALCDQLELQQQQSSKSKPTGAK